MSDTNVARRPSTVTFARNLLQRGSSLGPIEPIVSVWVLFAFAVAQPLLDLLGRNPEFFLARAAPAVDIVLIAVALLFGVPAVLGLLMLAARMIHPLVGAVVHCLLFTSLTAALVVSISARTPMSRLDGWIEVSIAVVLGLAAWAAYVSLRALRTGFRYAAIGPFVFGFVFLVLSPTSQLLGASGSVQRPAGVEVGNPVPVVIVVFDEFPLASIIDSRGEIIDETYPNFARLASDGLWFRNAVTVEQQTEQAIPTMLTGRHPSDREAIPITADYPLSLFSLLSDSYDIQAVESVTELCPEYACSNRSRVVAPAGERWDAAARDLAVVTAHTLLPADLGESLPSIENTWGNFTEASAEARDEFNIVARFNERVDADRRADVNRFLAMLSGPAEEPTLYYAHVLLPHIPWSYIETGQKYVTGGRAPGSTPAGWGGDEWLVMQAYQRHLIQVQYTDSIVGELIANLEESGRYDDALVVVAADHGTADIPNVEHRRVITPNTVGHIAAVPLFVKLPGMIETGIDDYRAETVDILPTVADVLDLDIPWNVDGTSLLASVRPERTTTTMFGPKGEVTFGTDGTEKLEVAAHREEWFLSGDPFSLVPPGFGELLGVQLDEMEIVDDDSLSIRIDNSDWYESVELDQDPFPARLTGTITDSTGGGEEAILAVSLNGRVVAVVRTYSGEGPVRFQAMLPRHAFRTGPNQIEVVRVPGSAEQVLAGTLEY
jgi:hypothetical protein